MQLPGSGLPARGELPSTAIPFISRAGMPARAAGAQSSLRSAHGLAPAAKGSRERAEASAISHHGHLSALAPLCALPVCSLALTLGKLPHLSCGAAAQSWTSPAAVHLHDHGAWGQPRLLGAPGAIPYVAAAPSPFSCTPASRALLGADPTPPSPERILCVSPPKARPRAAQTPP